MNSKKRVGPSANSSPENSLHALIMSALRNSMRAIGIPHWSISTTVSTALCTLSKEEMAAAVASGIPCRRTVAWVMTPGRKDVSAM